MNFFRLSSWRSGKLGFMKTRVIVVARAMVFCGIAATTLPAPGVADSGKTVIVPMTALNGSGETGTTTLRAQGNKTVVIIKLSGGSDIEQPAHFHTGTCEKYTPRPLYPLNDVVNGGSTTTIDVPLDKLVGGDLIINVHKSYADIATQAACGVSKPS
jgi:hypothetical protein